MTQSGKQGNSNWLQGAMENKKILKNSLAYYQYLIYLVTKNTIFVFPGNEAHIQYLYRTPHDGPCMITSTWNVNYAGNALQSEGHSS